MVHRYRASHSAPPQGATPANTKRQATAAGAGKAPAGNTTNTGTPRPSASATEPHVPEPKPAKLTDGRKAAGAAPQGNATSKPLPAAHHCTNAAERSANEARATRPPTKNEPTRNTDAAGKAERTRLSMPWAQPTPTAPENEATAGKKALHEAAAAEPARREPEKATQGKAQTKEANETIIKTTKNERHYKRA